MSSHYYENKYKLFSYDMESRILEKEFTFFGYDTTKGTVCSNGGNFLIRDKTRSHGVEISLPSFEVPFTNSNFIPGCQFLKLHNQTFSLGIGDEFRVAMESRVSFDFNGRIAGDARQGSGGLVMFDLTNCLVYSCLSSNKGVFAVIGSSNYGHKSNNSSDLPQFTSIAPLCDLRKCSSHSNIETEIILDRESRRVTFRCFGERKSRHYNGYKRVLLGEVTNKHLGMIPNYPYGSNGTIVESQFKLVTSFVPSWNGIRTEEQDLIKDIQDVQVGVGIFQFLDALPFEGNSEKGLVKFPSDLPYSIPLVFDHDLTSSNATYPFSGQSARMTIQKFKIFRNIHHVSHHHRALFSLSATNMNSVSSQKSSSSSSVTKRNLSPELALKQKFAQFLQKSIHPEEQIQEKKASFIRSVSISSPLSSSSSSSSLHSFSSKNELVVFRERFDKFDVDGTNFFYQQGPDLLNVQSQENYVCDDGIPTVSNGVLTIDSTIFRKSTIGVLGHPHWLAFRSTRFQTPTDGRELRVEAEICMKQIYNEESPFPQEFVSQSTGDGGIENMYEDPRLSTAGFICGDFNTFMIFDIMFTNKVIYALYERLPFGRPDYGGSMPMYQAFTHLIPIATRSPNDDFIKVGISINRKEKVVHWLLNGKSVFEVNRIGYPLPDSKYKILDLDGEPEEAIIEGINYGFGTFTLQDMTSPFHDHGRQTRALIPLSPPASYYQPSITTPFGKPIPMTDEDFVTGYTFQQHEKVLNDQGAILQVRNVQVSRI